MKRLVCLVAMTLALFGALESPAIAGTVEGTVTPVKWAQEVEVCAIGIEISEWCASPKADGSYVYPGVQGTVTFEFIPTYRSDLLTQYYDHKPALADAGFIEVGNEVRKGINADLLEGGGITGVVTAQAGGAQLPEVEVCAIPVPPLKSKSCDETDASGDYSLHSLPSGLYKVGFWGQASSAEYQPTYYEGQSSLARATPVKATAEQTTSGIDAALVKGSQISGQVFAAGSGMPLGDIAVCLFSAAEADPGRCTDTGEDGGYAFQGLPSGSYQVGFSLEDSEIGEGGETTGADLYESQYYDGVSTRAQAAAISFLAQGTVEGVDARLSRFPTVPSSATRPIVGGPPGASIAVVPEPEAKPARCKKPKHKVKVAGKIRCVNRVKRKKPTKHRKPNKSGHG